MRSYPIRALILFVVAIFILIAAIFIWFTGSGSHRSIDAIGLGIASLVFFLLSWYMYQLKRNSRSWALSIVDTFLDDAINVICSYLANKGKGHYASNQVNYWLSHWCPLFSCRCDWIFCSRTGQIYARSAPIRHAVHFLYRCVMAFFSTDKGEIRREKYEWTSRTKSTGAMFRMWWWAGTSRMLTGYVCPEISKE